MARARTLFLLALMVSGCALTSTEIRELGRAGDSGALAALLPDERSWVREEACLALGEARDPGAARRLQGILLDAKERTWVRAAAARALSDLRDTAAAPVLVGLMAQSELAPEIKIAGMEALCACAPEEEALSAIGALAGDEDLLVAAVAETKLKARCR
jgi:HEAT repeat protein